MEYLERLPYLALALGAGVIVLGVFAVFGRLKKDWTVARKARQLERLLDGQSLEEVLSAAPYKYGHFQGEDGFRIWDERVEEGVVHFAYTPLDAQLWIVKTYLSERNEREDRMGNGGQQP